MQTRWSRGRILVGSIVFVLAVAALLLFVPHEKESPHQLGEKLLLAVDEHDWARVKTLLEQGADPNLTAFTPPKDPGPIWNWFYEHGLPNPDWRARIEEHVNADTLAPDWSRPSPISQAIDQDNLDAVKLLLQYKATADIDEEMENVVSNDAPNQIEMMRLLIEADGDGKTGYQDQGFISSVSQTGNRSLIDLVENAAKVPLTERDLSQVPFASDAQSAVAEAVPGTIGVEPLRRALWISPHELLVLRKAPRSFAIIDLNTGARTDLPELSRRWAAQELFKPSSLVLSPDGRWLLGFAGTKARPTWLATEVHGNGFQEWDRDVHPTNDLNRNENPCIAWQDDLRIVELTDDAANLRTRGEKEVRQVPVDDNNLFLGDYVEQPFSFPKPKEGLIGGGDANYDDSKPDEVLAPMIRLTPQATGWRMEDHTVTLKASDFAGRFAWYAPSPNGAHIAWMNYFDWSGAVDILITNSEGKNARIVYEYLRPNDVDHNHGKTNAAARPWLDSLQWAPQGDGLIFWTGETGQNGLCLLHLTPEELR